MKIINIPASDNTRDTHELKIQAVVDLLCEYRQTSTALISKRLGQSVHSTSSFINQLLKKGILKRLRNPYTRHSLVRLGTGAAPYIPDSVNRSLIFRNKVRKTIAHHLAIQESALKHIHLCSRITYSSALKTPKKGQERRPITDLDVPYRPYNMDLIPDSLLEFHDGRIVALEMELTSKGSSDYIYWLFGEYAREIQSESALSDVLFVFRADEKGGETSKDLNFYYRLFSEEQWPIVNRKKIIGQVIHERTSDVFTPNEKVRKHFFFDII